MTTRQNATGEGAKPKFLVRCGCEEGQNPSIECDHDAFGNVAAKCTECDSPAEVQIEESVLLCDACANPCFKCEGVGCSACGETGGEAVRRSLQSRAELPAFTGTWMGRVSAAVADDEVTARIEPETMARTVSR